MPRALLWIVPLMAALAAFAACSELEEVLPTATPAPQTPGATAPSPEPAANPFLTPAPGPPTSPYSCIYTVANGEARCLPLNDPLVKDCPPIQFQSRAGCLPPGAGVHSVISEGAVPGATPLYPQYYSYISRGNSVIKWGDEVIEYYVAPEDETDFRGLKEVFLPGGATPPPPPYPYNCRFIVFNSQIACLPLDNPLVRACVPIDFRDRSACAPPDARFDGGYVETPDPATGEVSTTAFFIIRRGNSIVKYNSTEVIEYNVAPEDEIDFKGLRELFKPRQ